MIASPLAEMSTQVTNLKRKVGENHARDHCTIMVTLVAILKRMMSMILLVMITIMMATMMAITVMHMMMMMMMATTFARRDDTNLPSCPHS